MHQEFKNESFITLGLDVWDGSPSQVQRQFIERTKTTYPLLLHASGVGRLYGLGRTRYVVVDHDGVVRYINTQPFAPPIIRQAISTSLKALAESQTSANGDDTSIGEWESLPEHFALLANYPNPFNAATIIRFRLGTETEVTINIFDAAGRSVRRLAAGRFGPGAFELTWDGRDDGGHLVSSGVYFYRLRAPGHRATRSMVLLR